MSDSETKETRARTRGDRVEGKKYSQSENQKDTAGATAAAEAIIKKAAKFMEFPNTSSFIKLRYKGTVKNKEWKHGENFLFDLESQGDDNPLPSKSELRDVIKLTIENEFKQHRDKRAREDSSSGNSEFNSPQKTASQGEKGKCVICHLDYPMKDGLEVATVGIGCSYNDKEGDPCENEVHLYCLGFPRSTESQAQLMPDWCCKLHAGELAKTKKTRKEGKEGKKGKK